MVRENMLDSGFFFLVLPFSCFYAFTLSHYGGRKENLVRKNENCRRGRKKVIADLAGFVRERKGKKTKNTCCASPFLLTLV